MASGGDAITARAVRRGRDPPSGPRLRAAPRDLPRRYGVAPVRPGYGAAVVLLRSRGLGRHPAGPRAERVRALRGFGVMGLVSLVVVAAAAFWGLSTIAHHQALQAVARQSQQLARLTMAPVLTTPAVRGDPAAVATVDAVVRSRMSDGSVRRITVWDPAGRVVYSDRAVLRGRRFPLPRQAVALFAAGGPAVVVAGAWRTWRGADDVGGGDVPGAARQATGRPRASPPPRRGPGTAWSSRHPFPTSWAAGEAAHPAAGRRAGRAGGRVPAAARAGLEDGRTGAGFGAVAGPAAAAVGRGVGPRASPDRAGRCTTTSCRTSRRWATRWSRSEPDLDPATRPVVDRARAIVQRDVGTLRRDPDLRLSA